MISAQEIPVNWSFGAEHVEGNKYLVKFIADIDKGWVLYGQDIDEGGPIPTGFYFEESDQLSFIGDVEERSKAIKSMDEMFGMEITKFKDKAEFVQLVELKNPTGNISGELEFMTCDGARCLPPTTVDFNIKIE